MTIVARLWSFQKSGFADSSSISAILRALDSGSKEPPEDLGPLTQFPDSFLQRLEHLPTGAEVG